VTLVVGSSLALFLYPHPQTGFLAARNRRTVKRNIAALPVYTLMLGLIALLGFAAIAGGVTPVGGNRTTIIGINRMTELVDGTAHRATHLR
jgi:SSS family solute:Na+ symporter